MGNAARIGAIRYQSIHEARSRWRGARA